MSSGSQTSTLATIRPVIAEVLRTRVLPSSLLLRVERVIDTRVSKRNTAHGGQVSDAQSTDSVHPQTYRLLLSDEELMVQALLHSSLHYCVQSQDIRSGSVLDIKRFKVRRADRLNGEGRIVYFAIDDLEVVRATKPPVQHGEDELSGGFLREDMSEEKVIERPAKRKRSETEQQGPLADSRRDADDENMLLLPSSQESEGFETVPEQSENVQKRRQTLREPDSTTAGQQWHLGYIRSRPRVRRKSILGSKPQRGLDEENLAGKVETENPAQHATLISEAQLMNRTSLTSETSVTQSPTTSAPTPSRPHDPPPLHTLASLIKPDTLLPTRNYTLCTFALISWVSPSLIWRPHSPFPPKRHIKIHDPSISHRKQGITVSVFVDATHFKPSVGTVALFRGLVMRKWEGEVILNAYSHLKEVIWQDTMDGKDRVANGGWYVDDEMALKGLGLDVDGMRVWWEKRNTGRVKG